MRQALNENPMVQLAVVGVFGVAFAALLFTMVLGGEDEQAPVESTPAATAPAASAGSASAAPTTPSAAGAETAPVAPEPSSTTPPSGGATVNSLESGEGMPKPVVSALEADKAVAIMVYNPEGRSDRTVRGYAEAVGPRGDVVVFTVSQKEVSDYSAITQGLEISRTPALITIRPPKLEGGDLVATVSYGFRGERSVEIAIEDALYAGSTRPSHPG